MAPDRERVTEIARQFLPPDLAEQWLSLLRPAVALGPAAPAPGTRPAAVLGGSPDLPPETEWPVWDGYGPLSFVASVDLAALAGLPLDIALPPDGTLLFFYFDGQLDDGGGVVGVWDPDSLAGARVLHVPAAQPAAPREAPGGLKTYPRVELAAEPIVTYPDFEHPDLDAKFLTPEMDPRTFLDHPVNNDDFHRALGARRPGPRHQVGGYASPIQGPVESEVALVAFGGQSPGDDALLQSEQARWTLLAQIDTDDDAGMMWGDVGTLYWLARREDLTPDRLAPTSFTWQCC
jgi:hypothetical protein